MEYWLQKKTLGGWQQVTWYNDVEQARKNYLQCVGKGDSGYAWRLIEAKTIEEALLNDVVEVPNNNDSFDNKLPDGVKGRVTGSVTGAWGGGDIRDIDIPFADAMLIQGDVKRPWGQPSQDKPKSSGWSGTPSAWGKPTSVNPSPAVAINSDAPHGLSGSVWLIHHGKKHKTRVASNLVDGMIAEGYVRGGPATKFEG